MSIKPLSSAPVYKRLFQADSNERVINVYKLHDCQIVNGTGFYPNTLLDSDDLDGIYNPLEERVMSLKDNVDMLSNSLECNEVASNEGHPVFFFVYNTDNYYHFVYDTLPYLISYFELKAEIPDLKLLINYPNPQQSSVYKFVTEFLDLLGIGPDDLMFLDHNVLYPTIYVSSSYTHGTDSNLPPRNEVYDFFQSLVCRARLKAPNFIPQGKKLYISRRTWLHNDFSNIGTNYTTRRKLVNEDQVVSALVDRGYTEVFTEMLSTVEKILLFNSAECVVGAIGGGLCNVLFSNPGCCKLIALVSPTFLDVNGRFLHSFKSTEYHLFTDVRHTEFTEFKSWMRVRVPNLNIVGEIIEVSTSRVLIQYSTQPVAGWNNQNKFETMWVNKELCIKLDKGLNSSWELNLDKLLAVI